MDELRGRVAVITGGGSGIGRATALSFAREGAIPVIADVDIERARAVEHDARELGVEAAAVRCDVTSDADFAALRDITVERFDRVDIVMNNVSMIPIGRPETLPMDAWQRTIDVNLLSVVRSLHVFLPILLEQGSGHIVNTASTAGLFAYAFERLPYSATKAAVIGMSEALALYLRPKGIGVSCLCPGPVATNIGEQITVPRPDADQQPARPRGPGCWRGRRPGGRCRAGQHVPRAHPPGGARDPRAARPGPGGVPHRADRRARRRFRHVKVGIHLPQYGRVASADAIRRAAVHAEELGFADVWVSDHVAIPASQDYPSPYLYDPLMTLAWAAAATTRIGLGTSVLVLPQHTPLYLANALASLDRLSDGRLTIAVGVGWSAAEFAALGQNFHDRGQRTDEIIDLLRACWRDDPTSFDGEHYQLDEIRVLPKPAHDIPIWVGGSSEPAYRRAVDAGRRLPGDRAEARHRGPGGRTDPARPSRPVVHDLVAHRLGSRRAWSPTRSSASRPSSKPPGSSTSSRRRGATTSTTGSARWSCSPASPVSRSAVGSLGIPPWRHRFVMA